MKATGIVRRIDDLGRVVVPKEIRKVLRIREGDPLEIYTGTTGEVILKKYSPITGLKEIAKSVADGVSEETAKTCIVVDNNAVVCVGRNKNKELVGKEISQELFKMLCERKSSIINRADMENATPITQGEEQPFENLVIVPIVALGDCYGGIILADNDKGSRFTMAELRYLNLASKLISGQLED